MVIQRIFISMVAAAMLALAGCSPSDELDTGPLVLAAASMAEALEAAADEWEAKGHKRPVLSLAGTSALARQVEAGARGDIFIAADEQWMDELVGQGLIAQDSLATLAGNRLVLVAPTRDASNREITPGFPLADWLGDGRLAMADPEAVPAGRYAMQALTGLNVWDAVSGQLAIGENVRVALRLVSSQEAPLGIVYATDAQADPSVQIVGTFPEESHAPIVYPVARLASSANPEAEAFQQFLLSDEGQTILTRFGFTTGQ